jgi:hypothetical protein
VFGQRLPSEFKISNRGAQIFFGGVGASLYTTPYIRFPADSHAAT